MEAFRSSAWDDRTASAENDKIIVWDFVLPAGEETPVHTHDHSYMWFAVQGAPLQIYDEHGNDVGLFPVPTDGVFELKVQDGTIEVMSEIGKGVKVPVVPPHNWKASLTPQTCRVRAQSTLTQTRSYL